MWISSFMAKNIKENTSATTGSVSDSKGSSVEVEASRRHMNVPLVAPYGISCVPPVGAQAVLVHTSAQDACVGVVCEETTQLQPGELMLRSAGGASILLKNDGKVYINGKELGGV